jgi:serine protease inhibitor
MKYVDFIDDWKTTWVTMNARTANETNGRLDDQLIPKGEYERAVYVQA